jgi:osmoprotectant transport system substrate-binding protein
MRTNRSRVIGAGLLALAMLATACGDSGGDAKDGPEIVIAAQDFGESEILAEIYKGALTSQGYNARVQRVGGFRDLELAAFDSGDINLAPEYAASMLEYLNEGKGEASGDATTPSGAVDTNAFVITAATAESLGIQSLSDLAEKGADLKLGGPPDCETNPFCIPGLLRVYGLDLSANFTPLQAGIPTADALDQGAIDVGIIFSTSALIADRGYVLLEDDKNMLAADNVVPVVTQELLDAYGDELKALLDAVSSQLTTAALTEMNKRFDIDNENADDIAADWLAANGY